MGVKYPLYLASMSNRTFLNLFQSYLFIFVLLFVIMCFVIICFQVRVSLCSIAVL